MSQKKTIHCPECGSRDIREKNVAYAELRVRDWELSEDEKTVVGTMNYDMDVETDWETEDGVGPYVCRECQWRGNLEDLVIRGDAIAEALSDNARASMLDWLTMPEGGERSDDAIIKITDANGSVICTTNASLLKLLAERGGDE